MSETTGKRLPPGWSTAELGAVGELICGQSPQSSSVNRDGEGSVYVSGPEQWDGAEIHTGKWTTSPARVVPSGTVFITVKGAGVGTVFPGIEAAIGRDIYAFRPDGAVTPGFIVQALRYTTSEIVRQAKGDIPGLSKTHILTHQIALPPLPEQERIASTVEERLSELDAGVVALERARAKLKQYRAAVLKAAVEGELTAEWREQNPDVEPASELLARMLAERRRRWEEAQLRKFEEAGKAPPRNWKSEYKEPAGPDTSNLPNLPHGWCWVTVDQCRELIQYGTSSKTNSDVAGIPVLRMGNIRVDGSLDHTDTKYLPCDHEEFPALLLKQGDLLINRTNSAELVGKTGLYRGLPSPCSFASYLIRVRLLLGVAPTIVAYALNGDMGRRWKKTVVTQTVGQANVNGTKLAGFVFPLSPEDEQAAITDLVEDQLSVIEHLGADLEGKLKTAQALRQSILRHAFAGQLVPQDPSDEPASELLKRIAVEREERARQARAAKAAGGPRKRGRRPKK